DKLWFYAGLVPALASYRLERNLNITRVQNGMPVVDASGFTQTDPLSGTEKTYYASQQSLLYIGKLTLLIDPNNTLTLSVFGSPTSSGGDGDFGINPRDGSVEIENANSGGLINGSFGALAHNYVSSAHDVSLKWSSAFRGKSLLLDVIAGIHHEDNAVRAADGTKLASGEGLSNVGQVLWQRTTPGVHTINDFEASAATSRCEPAGSPEATLCPVSTYYSGGPGPLNESALDRFQGKIALTSIFSALGQHVAKAGFDLELMRYESQRGYSGTNIFFEGEDGTTFSDYRRFGFLVDADKPQILDKFEAVSSSATVGGFVQDSWNVLDRVTINAGVRYDAQFLYGYDERLALALPNQISPRVGVIYDFTREGRSKVFASFARFYENVPLDMVDRSIPGERQITSTHDASVCDPRYLDQQKTTCDSDAGRVVQGDLYSPNQIWGVVGSDKSPVDPDIEPQSSDEIAIGGEYEIFANARIGIQYTKRWQNRVIEDMSRDEAQTYFIGNPGYGIATDFPKPTRDYDALTVFFQKTFKDLWLAQASYTLSYLRGNWAGLFRPESGQLDPNINSDFDLTSLLDNREGPLPGDRRHSLRILGAKDFVLPYSILVNAGLSYSGRSGEPTNYLGSHPIYGADQVFILPRGSGERMPWTHSIDAHIGVGFKLSKDSDAQVYMDIFNLFNFQGVVARDQRYTQDSVLPIPGGATGDLETDKFKYENGEPFDPSVSKNANFGNPTGYQAPRQFRIGARVTF
ncbi:MAG: TonB-dependent receptor, partial [Polyangiaceae bacterium]|nr:TonB-dependent receptor [Polyangiaceae bacterium]